MAAAQNSDGWFVLPKKVGMFAIIGGVVYLIATVWTAAEMKADLRADIAALARSDVESRARGDDVRRRLGDLEKQRIDLSDRLTRIEEQNKISLDWLREIRADMKAISRQ
jgi:hypothetical protein